jgi:hypothetical protein
VTEHDHWSAPRDTVPDLGFVATPGPPAPPRAAPPSVGNTPQAPPPFGAAAPPPFPYAQPHAAPARGGLPGWAIALICAGAGGLLLMIAAAVAIPVFLHQRDAAVARATTLSPAARVGGLTRSTDARMQQDIEPMTAALSACGCFQSYVTSGYVVPDRTHVLIVIGARFLRPADEQTRESFQRSFWGGGKSDVATLGPERDLDPGRLGGTLRCAAMSTGRAAGQLCVSVDAGAVVVMLDMGRPGQQPDLDLIVTARESMEHRT